MTIMWMIWRLLLIAAILGASWAATHANYTLTQGGGAGNIQFGSNVVGGVHYPMSMSCDPVTPTQCGSVSAAGAQKVDGSAATVNITPTDCSGSVATGGTAQNAFAANAAIHGFTVMNIDTTEVLWFSSTATAAAAGAGSYPLPAATATTFAGAGSFTTPSGMGINTALSVVAATTGHKWSCTRW